MDMNWDDILKIAFGVGVVFLAVGQWFYRIFIKPAAPGHLPHSVPRGPAKAGRNLEEFIDELRRDLGHGESPPPRTDGLLDTQTAPEKSAGQLLGAEGRDEPIWKPEPLVHAHPEPHEIHPVPDLPPQHTVGRSLPSKGLRRRERTAARAQAPAEIVELWAASSAEPALPAAPLDSVEAIETGHWDSLTPEEIEQAVIVRELLSPPLSRRRHGR